MILQDTIINIFCNHGLKAQAFELLYEACEEELNRIDNYNTNQVYNRLKIKETIEKYYDNDLSVDAVVKICNKVHALTGKGVLVQ